MAFKVCVCGGAGGIGQPLSMLMAMDERVATLCVQDLNVAMVPAAGVAADLSHIDTPAEVKHYAVDPKTPPVECLEECFTGCDLVIVPAGMPRKPGMTRDDLFNVNAGIAHGIVTACQTFCPQAVIALIVNPVNSVVPAMCELHKSKGLDPRKILGITTLDLVRANKFVAKELGVKPSEVGVPVVGGHAGATILPLLSQVKAGDISSLSTSTIESLDKRIQEAGTEVVQAKAAKGSATLSMAYAGARLAKSILSGLSGTDTEEYAYVPSDLCGLPYFSSKVTLGKTGVEQVHPLGDLSDYEKRRLEQVCTQLQGEIDKGVDYALKFRLAAGLFAEVAEAPADPILGTTIAFQKDESAEKINLGVGAYRTAEGKPYVLPVVIKAEEGLLADEKAGQVNKEYFPIDGPQKLKDVTQAVTFGADAAAVKEGRIASVQALSGTGALRVTAEFIKTMLPPACHTIFVSDPTWGNHTAIFKCAGLTVKTYPYWKEDTRSLDLDGMMSALAAAPRGSVILLHACAHNPTGVDPSEEQWGRIADLCVERQLVPLMDNAYQGYASGSLDRDAFACRLFESKGLEMFMCQSFAKNLGLYGERIGMVHVLCKDAERAKCVLSQLKLVIRPMYSSPPIHGAHLVMRVMGEDALLEQWKTELKAMADRILDVRAKLRKGLEDKGTPGTWNHVTEQIGMFSYTGLSKDACECLIDTHHIYLLKSGRISLAGLNDANLEYMVKAVDEAVRATAPPPEEPKAEEPKADEAKAEEAKPTEEAKPAEEAKPEEAKVEEAKPPEEGKAEETKGEEAPAEELKPEGALPAGSPVAAARALREASGDVGYSHPEGGLFADVAEAPADPILGTTLAFQKDEAAEKINLGVGAYRTAEGKPYVLPVVLQAEEAILQEYTSGTLFKEYSTIDGPARLKEVTQTLLFGADAASVKEGRIASVQALSGTGALRVVAEFIKRQLHKACHTIYVSDPTWGNHTAIFKRAGMEVKTYPYWKEDSRSLDFDGMLGTLKEAPMGSVILLHACAHNPTGVDPTEEQWGKVADLLIEKKLVPLLDSAYQGYASGSVSKDAFACQLLEKKGLEMFVCQSFAKNLGLYGERIGMVHVTCKDAERAKCVLSQMKLVVRPMYSSPPIHGAHLVTKILGDDALRTQWEFELKAMADRVLDVRAKLRKGLEDKGTPGTWNHVTDQIGMFSYTGLKQDACERLIEKHHIYLLKSGRISLAGLNDSNLEHMIQAVDEAVRAGA